MKKFIGSWSFYKKTLIIAIPIMIQNLITNFVALIDNIMVGKIGTEQMSGVAISNQLFFVFNLAVFGSISGAGIFCAQFFGKKDYKGVQSTFRFKFLTAGVITLLGCIIFLIFGGNLISLYLHDAQKGIDLNKTFFFAKEYMAVMLIGLIPFSFEQVYSSTLREGGISTPPMIAGIVAVITNIILNYLLIFGIGFFPELGVTGAAVATVISRFVQLFIVILWSHSHKNELPYIKNIYKTFKIPANLAKRIFIKGCLPLTTNECLWGASVAALAQCYSVRGIDVVAGQNIANTAINLFNVLFIAFGSGVSVVSGQLLGADDIEGAKDAAPKLIFFSGAMCVVVGFVMALVSKVFPEVYNTTQNVKSLATSFILISAIFMPVHSVVHSTYFILRSGGKTLITFLFDSVFAWGISVPSAFLLAHYTNLNIVAIYISTQLIESIKCVIGLVLIKKGVWISNIINENKFNS